MIPVYRFALRFALTGVIFSIILPHFAKQIFFVAAVVISGYIGFIVFVVLLAQFISWIKDGAWRKATKKW